MATLSDVPHPRPGGYLFYEHGQRVELRIHGKALASEGSKLYLEPWDSPHSVWTITHLHDDVVDIKAHDGHFLAGDKEGRAYLNKGPLKAGDTDFHLEHHGDGKVAFRSKHGHYLSVHEEGGWFFHPHHGSDSMFYEVLVEQ